MDYQSSSDVRKNFSSVIDMAVHERPQFIKRTHDYTILLSSEILKKTLAEIQIHYSVSMETDNSYVLECIEIEDLIATGKTLEMAVKDLATQLVEYSQEYYDNFNSYSMAPNRKDHIRYIMRVLLEQSISDVEALLVCQNGKQS